METFKQRLKRYLDNDPGDTFGWMTVLMQNHHVLDLRSARENGLYLCVYLLAHATIQTISQAMFGKTGLSGTRFFLQTFLDAPSEEKHFSQIGSEIHAVRNIIAHQAYSGLQHSVEYFADKMDDNWRKEEGILFVNPARYSLQVEAVFRTSAIFQAFQNQPDQVRLLRKYQFIGQWLSLERNDPVARNISALKALGPSDFGTREVAIRNELYQKYEL
jgi:hypothetical protein